MTCGWCLRAPATTRALATPSCAPCATATPRERINRWLMAVSKGLK